MNFKRGLRVRPTAFGPIDTVRRWWVEFTGPLNSREKFIFYLVLTFLFFVLINPYVVANNENIGRMFLLPSSNCVAETGWVNQDFAAGVPSEREIDGSNSAINTNDNDSLSCEFSDKNNNFRAGKFALHLRYLYGSVPPAESTSLDSTSSDQIELFERAVALPVSEQGTSLDPIFKVELSTNNGAEYVDYHYETNKEGNLTIALPDFGGNKLKNLKINITPLQTNQDKMLAVENLSLSYEVLAEKSFDTKLLKASDNEVFSSAPKFEVSTKSVGDGVWQGLINQVSDDQVEIDARFEILNQQSSKIEDIAGTVEFVDSKLDGSKTYSVTPSKMPPDLAPGEYKLLMVITDADGVTNTTVQDFTWGVLATNFTTTDSPYNADSQMHITVLNEKGQTVCDSDITVEFKQGESSVSTHSTNFDIKKGDRCEEYGAHIDPDYYLELPELAEGSYSVVTTATNENGTYQTFDEYIVNNSPDLIIKRESATRLFPIVDYQMTITLSTKSSGTYEVTEQVPKSFEVKQFGKHGFTVEEFDDHKLLRWQVFLTEEETEVSYLYDAPDISPAFYLFGPISAQSDSLNYTEARQWQLAGDAIGRMLLLFDGASVPNGWTCVSCNTGEDFFQRFIRGNSTYGGTGGSVNHTHTANGSITATTAPANAENRSGTNVVDQSHSHTYTPSFTPTSNLPSFRNLKVIRFNTAGSPGTLPAGVIGLFDATPPAGWTAYSAQNGFYIRGENTITTGGSNTHTSAIGGDTSAPNTAVYNSRSGGSQVTSASSTHTHTVSLNTTSANHEPPFRAVVLAKLNSAATAPNGMISMWDDTPAGGWVPISNSGDAFHQVFLKGAASYGATGGSTQHNHPNVSGTTGIASASINARSGSSGSDVNHTHTVNVTNISTENHLPPYRDVILAKRVPGSTYNQSSYRFFENTDTTNVGNSLAAQDTAASLSTKGAAFRLRLNIHVANDDLAASGENFKLQYSTKSGTCDIGFSGETYVDVSTSSGDIRYYNNPSPTDGSGLTTNANDPTHGSDTVVGQTYEESNNFTNLNAINQGQDGMWDFALQDFSAPGLETYCFRVVKANGDTLSAYTTIPEVTVADTPAQMILMYDGASIPSGWSCISCAPGDDLYQRFVRGESTYGATGGQDLHTPTATVNLLASTDPLLGNTQAGTGVHDNTHSHTLSPVFSSASIIPQYRTLKFIRYDSGVPTTIPTGAIAIFSGTVPAGWTQLAAQNGNYVYGESTIGSTGGNNTHSHTIAGTTSDSTGSEESPRNGSQDTVAGAPHSHTINGNTDTLNHEPPYINVILARSNSDQALPTNFITMWNKPAPGGWSCMSCTSGDAIYRRFIKPAASYGATGGSPNHTHANQSITTSAPTPTQGARNGSNSSSDTHTHQVDITSYSSDSNLPPYTNVIFARRGVNNAPSSPTNLVQKRASAGTTITTGGWANETQVTFQADVSDPDNPDDVSLCVEVKQLGTPFVNAEDACGNAVNYSGSPLSAEVTLTGLSDTAEYHWQARTKDAAGAYSGWVSYGANPESNRDFAIDATSPTGTVYDGTSAGVDIDFNGGSLDEISANWTSDGSISGLASTEYSIGTTAGNFDVLGWTATAGSSFTETGLNLNTSQLYYVNIRLTDNAENSSVISSDGQYVSPTLSFSTSTTEVAFGDLNSSNNYTSSQTTDLITSTNAYNGYEIRAYINALPTSTLGYTIPLFSAGSYASPAEWTLGNYGYGYHSSDNFVAGSNRFNNSPCPGGGSPPCYAPFSLTAPGDIVADNSSTISGNPIINETFTITHRVTTDTTQEAGTYLTTLIYTVVARY